MCVVVKYKILPRFFTLLLKYCAHFEKEMDLHPFTFAFVNIVYTIFEHEMLLGSPHNEQRDTDRRFLAFRTI